MIVFRFCPRSSRSRCFLRQKRNLSFSQWLRVSSPVTSYKDTILLPRTPFPARVEGQSRVQLDQEVINEAGFRKLYQRQHDDRADQEYYVLHDGPPYANGDPHLGHAVNKILKDVTARWQVVKGKRVHFRPGWDCHGLPIELKAVKGGNSESTPNPLNIRSVARTFARQTIERQKAEFVSWGVMADWENPYVTMDPDCVKQEIRAFYQLFKKGFVYQSYMPVYWSPSSQTALAESELEYNPSHQSVSAYVRFTLDQVPSSVKQAVQGEPCHLLAWTTTPWSLTANKAICFNPEAEYVIVRKVSGSSEVGEAECYVVSKTLLSSSNDLKEIFGESPEVVFAGTGADMLSDATYKQVLANGVSQSLPVLPASHVTTDSGTGLVHTAPAHGQDDYLVGIGHKLDLSCCVDDQGCLDETVSPPELRGLSVLDPETSRTVLRVLGDSVLKSSVISHSYPYDWRTKEPVILKASKQWFIDTKSLQKDALEAVKSIRIHPRTATNGFKGVLERRPYWCISRQRVWGVPIPVMYTRYGL